MRSLKAAAAGLGLTLLGLAAQSPQSAAQAPAQTAAPQQSDTVATIRERGMLICGTSPAAVGFGRPNSQGEWEGLDVEGCRAVAAAILGDAKRVRFVPASSQQRFTMLQSGEIDLLIRTSSWTLTREAALGLTFASINFYDGQAFVVRRASGIESVGQLDGATVCLQPGTTTEVNVADYFRSHNMTFSPVLLENASALQVAFLSGRCDVYTDNASYLASFRAGQGAGAELTLLPEIISKEPLGAVMRKGDWKFFDIVRWTHFAQLTAEELGITKANIDSFADNNNPEIQRFMGRTGGLGEMLGLKPDWAVQVVRQVGNYGEMWERNIGPLGVQRGMNRLWNQGGLMYAPPMR